MLSWFSSWMRDIISVILLAAIVDLLLPNKSMQRYARLVTGLIMLLVILTPLLKLAQGDIQGKLDASIENWDQELRSSQIKIPSLDEILKKAESASGQTLEQATDLARTRLETEITTAVEKSTGLQVASVAASVSWDGNGGGAVTGVAVTLASAAGGADAKTAGTQGAAEVLPVEIRIDTPPIQAGAGGDGAGEDPAEPAGGTGSGESGSKLEAAAPQAAAAVRRLIAEGWQLPMESIQVLQEPG